MLKLKVDKVITKCCVRSSKGTDNNKAAMDTIPGTRKTNRNIKTKKHTDFEYGNIKVTSYKVDKTRKLTTSKSKLKVSKNKKLNDVESFSSRKKDVTGKGLKRKSGADSESEEKSDGNFDTTSNKKDKVKKQMILGNDKLKVKIGNPEAATVSQGVHNTRSKRKTKLKKQKNEVEAINKRKHENSDEDHIQGNDDDQDGISEDTEINSRSPVKNFEEQESEYGHGMESDELKTRTKNNRKVRKKVDADKVTLKKSTQVNKRTSEKDKKTKFECQRNNKSSCYKNVDDDAQNIQGEVNTAGNISRVEENDNSSKDENESDGIEHDVQESMEDDLYTSDENDAQTDTSDIACPECDILFSSKKEYTLHIRKSHKTCEHCNTSFETKLSLEEHLKESHNDASTKKEKPKTKVYKCTYDGCSKEFIKEINCQKHISKCHIMSKFECEICGLEFKEPELLRSHLKLIHDKEAPNCQLWKNRTSPVRYKCPYEGCDKDFGHQSNRKKHVNSVHLNIRNFHCEYCAFRFKTSNALKNHIAVLHTKDVDKKLYVCDVCKKAFPRKASLKLHVSVHSDVKSYVCTFEGCGKSFRLNTTLDKHKRVHTDEKPYNCFICEERFSRKIYRDTHMYKHTGLKNYSCDICQKTFSQKGNMITHKLLHSKERPIYKCPVCSQTFNFKSNMKKHLERHASDESFLGKRGHVDITGLESSEAGSQSCSKDFRKNTTALKKRILSNSGKKMAVNQNQNKQTFLGSLVFLMNPVYSPQKEKYQGKVNTTRSVSDVSEIKGNTLRKSSPLKINQPRSLSELRTEQGNNAVLLQESVGEKMGTCNRPAFYISVEKVTQHDSNGSVTRKAEDKLDSSANNKARFTIELNSDGFPVARLQDTRLTTSSDSCNYNISNSKDRKRNMEVSEQTVTEVMKGSSGTNVECKYRIVESEEAMSNVTNEPDNLQAESPTQFDVSKQIVIEPDSSDEESAVFEQIVNAIKQASNYTHEIVDTTVEDLIVNDSILQVPTENSDVLMDAVVNLSFPPSQ